MKKLLLTAALVALTTAGAYAAEASQESEKGWFKPDSLYVSLGAGWNHAQDADFKAINKNTVEYDEGWLGTAAIGHRWGGNLRTEVEGSYRRNDVDKVTGPGSAGGSGNFHSWNVMLNQYYDFNRYAGWTPYLGVGMGASFQEASHIGNAFTPATSINGWDTQFAYQGIAGLDYDITPRSTVGLRYNYFGTPRGRFDASAASGKALGEYNNHAILATYRWNWYTSPQRAAKPESAAMTTQPQQQPMQQDNTRTQRTVFTAPSEQAIEDSPYKIFFANNSAKLTSEGRKVVRDAATESRNAQSVVLHLTSNTDTTGTATHNDRLSEKRADTVRRALIAQGVDENKINVVSNAERELPIPTGDGVKEPRNRVVTIVLE